MLYVKLMWYCGLPWIYGQLEEGVGSVCHETDSVYWSAMDLWLIGVGSSASRSAKFGVVVFKASLLERGGQYVIGPCNTVTPSPAN